MAKIMTSSGQYFDYTDYSNYDFKIEEIAHHLSHLCRFAGATNKFYSVAQHCVIMSRVVGTGHYVSLLALMHDAAEAYCVDIPAPMKGLLPEYSIIENAIQREILKQYAVISTWIVNGDVIKTADKRMALTEIRDLMPEGTASVYDKDYKPYHDFKIEPVEPELARTQFIERYNELMEPK